MSESKLTSFLGDDPKVAVEFVVLSGDEAVDHAIETLRTLPPFNGEATDSSLTLVDRLSARTLALGLSHIMDAVQPHFETHDIKFVAVGPLGAVGIRAGSTSMIVDGEVKSIASSRELYQSVEMLSGSPSVFIHPPLENPTMGGIESL